MNPSSITIRNVYVMMAYAFRSVHADGIDYRGSEQFDHLHELFAEILRRGIGTQIKRGFHRDYLRRSDELATVRGRIDVAQSSTVRTRVRRRLVCEFDEYELDTPHNQALKSVLVLLIRHSAVSTSRKAALRRLLPHLDQVTLVDPRSIQWGTMTYHRANASYRALLGVCELTVRGLLSTDDSGKDRLESWISEEAMSRLYERFLREYFVLHHRELSPRAPRIAWDYEPSGARGVDQLPAMYTDLSLRRGRRSLIVDAKYYQHSLQRGLSDKDTVHSANLYQILSYVNNADTEKDGSVSGLLLYARTDSDVQPDVDVVIQGNRIGARTLDLNLPWELLRSQLEELVLWLDA